VTTLVRLASVEETHAFAGKFARTALEYVRASGCSEAVVIGLIGGLGAGKTAWVRGFVDGLPQSQPVWVSSPTYALVHGYETEPPVTHMDLYRLQAAAELDDLGFEGYLEEPGFVLVEWMDQVKEAQVPDRVEVRFEVVDADTRRLEILGFGRFSDWIQATGLVSSRGG
jgi:tRNA threonylcarbamoyladenosine biosynthesis protein TsaE